MRIVKKAFLRAAVEEHPRAADAVASWIYLVRMATWENSVQMRQTFTDVDSVKVRSGRTVYVFNLRHNEFRLIVAVHFDRGRVFTLRFLTHVKYDLSYWKDEL